MNERLELYDLDMTTPDIHGFVPDPAHIGEILTHTKEENQYVITDFAWMGATDEWGYVHRRISEFGPLIVRPLKDLAGNRHNGVPRYQEVDMYMQYSVD